MRDARSPMRTCSSSSGVGTRVATHVLLNKADKLSRGAGARVLADARKRLAPLAGDNDVQLFSATRRTGIEALGARLDTWLGYQPATRGA